MNGTVSAEQLELRFSREVEIVHLLASPLHRYEGRPSDGPLPVPVPVPLPMPVLPMPLPPRPLAPGVAASSPVPSQAGSREQIEVRAHLGVVGDRYFGREAHRRASVTVMAMESLDVVERELGVGHALDPAATRRNILVRGAEIDALTNTMFSLDSGSGEVLLHGHRPANPCAWMNVTLAEGAHRALRGRGGVRCEPLSDGHLTLGPATLRVYAPSA